MDIESIRHSLGNQDNFLPDIWHTLETLERTCEDIVPKILTMSEEILNLRTRIQDSTWNNPGCEKLDELGIVALQIELDQKEKRLREFRSTLEAARQLTFYYRFGSKDSNSLAC